MLQTVLRDRMTVTVNCKTIKWKLGITQLSKNYNPTSYVKFPCKDV